MIMIMTFIQYSSEFSYENDNILFQVIKIVFNLINDWWVIKYSEVVWCWCWLVQCTVAVEGGEPMPGRVRSAKVSAFLHHTTNHGPELGRGLRTVSSVWCGTTTELWRDKVIIWRAELLSHRSAAERSEGCCHHTRSDLTETRIHVNRDLPLHRPLS